MQYDVMHTLHSCIFNKVEYSKKTLDYKIPEKKLYSEFNLSFQYAIKKIYLTKFRFMFRLTFGV